MDIMNVPTNQLILINDTELLLVRQFNRDKLTKSKPKQFNFTTNNIIYDSVKSIYTIDEMAAHGEYFVFPSGYIQK